MKFLWLTSLLFLLLSIAIIGVVIAQQALCTTNCNGDDSPRYTCWLAQEKIPGSNATLEICKCVPCYNHEWWACPKFC